MPFQRLWVWAIAALPTQTLPPPPSRRDGREADVINGSPFLSAHVCILYQAHRGPDISRMSGSLLKKASLRVGGNRATVLEEHRWVFVRLEKWSLH